MRAVLKLTIDYDDEYSVVEEWGFIVEVDTQEGGE